jgi:hypothetical protein
MVMHTIATGTYSQPGILVSEVADASRCVVRNNVAWNNDSDFSLNGCVQSNNFSGSGKGAAGVVDSGFNAGPALANAESCLANAPHAQSVQSCWQSLYSAYYNAYRPQAGSALIDAGVIVSGYHCPVADDRGQDPNAACRHWAGAAPDQGPFEAGLNGNPDRTRCAVLGTAGCSAPPPSTIPPPSPPSNVRIIR